MGRGKGSVRRGTSPFNRRREAVVGLAIRRTSRRMKSRGLGAGDHGWFTKTGSTGASPWRPYCRPGLSAREVAAPGAGCCAAIGTP